MSWLDRVRGNITLTSPDGDNFVGKWIGDTRESQKQLGIFTYPKVDKQIVQDLGISGISYPLTIAFDGEDNDLEGTRFFDALSARGPWLINHPTKGQLFLQPTSFKEIIAPVTSGTITMFQTSWIDVALPASIISVEQLSALVETQNNIVEAAALEQLETITDQSSVENIQALKSETEKQLSSYDETINTLTDFSDEVSAKVDGIKRSIDDTLSISPIDLTVLGGQIQALMRAPAAITGNVLQQLRVYQEFVNKVSDISGNVPDQTNLNVTSIKEIFAISANSSSNLISVRSEPETRETAITSLNLITEQFIQITEAFDTVQLSYNDQLIENQYFSQSLSFVESSLMSAQTAAFLLSITFDLAIEKRFELKEDRAAIEIAITEYGSLGDNDANFDLFIDTNMLKGDEILMLPAGREVVVYV